MTQSATSLIASANRNWLRDASRRESQEIRQHRLKFTGESAGRTSMRVRDARTGHVSVLVTQRVSLDPSDDLHCMMMDLTDLNIHACADLPVVFQDAWSMINSPPTHQGRVRTPVQMDLFHGQWAWTQLQPAQRYP